MSYNQWLTTVPKQYRKDTDYDLQGYFHCQVLPYGHVTGIDGSLPETFKKPNNKYFSKGSIYSTPIHTGGEWRKDDEGTNYFVTEQQVMQEDWDKASLWGKTKIIGRKVWYVGNLTPKNLRKILK